MAVNRVPEFVAAYPDFVLPSGRCKHLMPDGMCNIYENRPLYCRVDKIFDCGGGPHKILRDFTRAYKNDIKGYYEATAKACHALQDYHLPEEKRERYRISKEAIEEALRNRVRNDFDGSVCPNCGGRLREQSCKLVCDTTGCGYRVTCAEF